MNVLFFGGWFFAVLALAIFFVVAATDILDSCYPDKKLAIPSRYHDGLIVCMALFLALTVLAYVAVGSIALWKGWFW